MFPTDKLNREYLTLFYIRVREDMFSPSTQKLFNDFQTMLSISMLQTIMDLTFCFCGNFRSNFKEKDTGRRPTVELSYGCKEFFKYKKTALILQKKRCGAHIKRVS